MSVDKSGGNLALLIDGDNVSSKVIAGLMVEVINYGTASVRRIYGDWTQPNLGGWKRELLAHSIQPVQQFAYTTGKNATDGAMIIDAMDLLYTGRFSSFALVSSDSDFTRLAARIREQGVTVYGFGERKTNSAFIAACDKFVYFDVLQAPEPQQEDAPTVPTVSTAQRPASLSALPNRPWLGHTIPMQPRLLDARAIGVLIKAIGEAPSYEDDWVNLADVGDRMIRISPDVNARNYGYDKLTSFVLASGHVQHRKKPLERGAPVALVRIDKAT